MPKKDITGLRFGKLVAISRHHQDSRSQWYWLCRCDCPNHNIVIVRQSHLSTGQTQSCGCIGNRRDERPLKDLLFRFEAKYIPEPNSGCWLWCGATEAFGYGKMSRGRRSEGSPEKAHRIAWELFKGSIPEGMNVLHRCDNPACVNPDHLFLGTQTDNMDDMRAKGRGSKPPTRYGEAHHKAKLTLIDIQEIRRRRANGESIKQLAAAYSVAKSTIGSIVNNKTWTDS